MLGNITLDSALLILLSQADVHSIFICISPAFSSDFMKNTQEEIYLVGYEGTIYHMDLSGAVFE